MKAKGNNALAAAIGPGKKRFADRYNAALIHNGGEGDKPALAELDMFRKDVGSFVRLYDFMSQIVDYGDPELEKKQIYLRHLERVIQPDNYTAPIDLSDVVLNAVKQVDEGKTDISLGDRDRPQRHDRRRLRCEAGSHDGRVPAGARPAQ